MKFVFMGTPDFAIPALEKLKELGEVVLVVTQRDAKKGRGKKYRPSPVKARALEMGLEVITPEDINSADSYRQLKQTEADLFVVVAYGQILKEKILKLPKKYCVNIHASLLPKFRGAAPMERAILAGEAKTGVTLMRMEEGLDTGDMAGLQEIELEGLDAGELETHLARMGGELLETFIKEVQEGKEQFIPQNEAEASYAEKLTKDTLSLHFNQETTDELVRHILALSPKYGARVKYGDHVLKLYGAYPIEDFGEAPPGTILSSEGQLVIKTLDGAIAVTEIQAPGKRRMAIEDFLRGNQLEKNMRLGD